MLPRPFLVAAAVVTLVLVACGGAEPPDPLAAAAERSAGAGGVRMQIESASFVGDSIASSRGSAGMDGVFAGDQGMFTLESSDVGAKGAAGYDTVFTEEDGHLVVYRRIDTPGGLPKGKSWSRQDADNADGFRAADASDAGAAFVDAATTPADVFELLERADDVAEVGAETIGGETARHYRATVLLRDALGHGALVPRGVDARVLSATTELPVDVWVDDADGYVRRVRIEVDDVAYAAPASDGRIVPVTGETTITMSEWGAVSIAVPPAAEVSELPWFVGDLDRMLELPALDSPPGGP